MCEYCSGACAGVDLAQLLVEPRRWLWTQLAAAAEKRGDSELVAGSVSVTTPQSAEERAAVVGLIGTLAPGARKKISLDELTRKLRTRAPTLTPGAVAAHAVGKRLAVKAAEDIARDVETERLARVFLAAFASFKDQLPRATGAELWAVLRRNGWASRLLAFVEPERVINEAAVIVAALPSAPDRIDRRRLAAEVLGDPHGLDEGTPVASFALALLAAGRRVSARDGPRRAWSSVGIECDDMTGGLIALGIAPFGWSIPSGDVVTVPPRVLEDCKWPPPERSDQWVFVTENPSIVTAAADAQSASIRLICTSGTPSLRELNAIDRLASEGWRVAVRADFDEAGLRHVNALLRAVRGAVTWRMSSDDYRESVRDEDPESRLTAERLPSTPWDTELASTMAARRTPAFEEALLPSLLADLIAGQPPMSSTVTAAREWLSISETNNALLEDPLLAWLAHHGAAAGFAPDNERAGYDPRTDFQLWLREKRRAFKDAVLTLLATRTKLRLLAARSRPSNDDVDATRAAMSAGTPVIANAAVEDTLRGLRGRVDMLVRSDVLNDLFPQLLTPTEATLRAQRLGDTPFHYRPVQIEYRAIELGDAGDAIGDRAGADRARMRMLALALGSMQGLTPAAGYLLGRTYRQRAQVFDGCFDRLARVDVGRDRGQLDKAAERAIDGLHLLKREGARWHPLPSPSVPQLFPNMRNADDAPWHSAKVEIAAALGELTLLPAVGPEHRRRAHAAGVRRVSDEGASASILGVRRAHAQRVDDVIAANRSPTAPLLPERFDQARTFLDDPAPLEFFVDVETVSNLDDDFTALPRINARAQIVMLGCGYFANDDWIFRQWIVDVIDANQSGEVRILDGWIAWLASVATERGVELGASRVCHWSAAEPITIEKAYASARALTSQEIVPVLPWFDVYREVMVANRAAVAGAFDGRLKSVCRIFASDTPPTGPEAGIGDGLAAMVAMWRANRETKEGTPISSHPLMQQVAAYNARDVRLLAELVRWLRANR